MSHQLLRPDPENLKLTAPVPLTRHPAAVYLDSLSFGSQPTMKQALDAISRSEALRDRFSSHFRAM